MQCPVYGIERCPLLRGHYYTQVLEVAFGTLLIVHYKEAARHSGVFVKRGSTVYTLYLYYELPWSRICNINYIMNSCIYISN